MNKNSNDDYKEEIVTLYNSLDNIRSFLIAIIFSIFLLQQIKYNTILYSYVNDKITFLIAGYLISGFIINFLLFNTIYTFLKGSIFYSLGFGVGLSLFLKYVI